MFNREVIPFAETPLWATPTTAATTPQPRAVPDVVGQSVGAARDILAASRFTAVVREEISSQPPGTVLSQDPPAGSSLSPSIPVTLVVAGQPDASLPNVVGQTVEVASDNIEGAGFEVVVENIDSSETEGTVVSTSPAGGASTEQGSTVTVRVSNGDRIEMPVITNRSVSDALAALRGAGWTGNASQLQQTREATLDVDLVGTVLNG